MPLCPSCGLTLSGSHQFVLHLLQKHLKESLTVRCPDCGKGGLKIKGLESHWRRLHGPLKAAHVDHTKVAQLGMSSTSGQDSQQCAAPAACD